MGAAGAPDISLEACATDLVSGAVASAGEQASLAAFSAVTHSGVFSLNPKNALTSFHAPPRRVFLAICIVRPIFYHLGRG